jgi:putative transposase
MGHKGHVLFRRFHAVLVESDRQLVDTLRYVLRNPVAAGMCSRPDDWSWSSYAATIGKEAAPAFLCTDWLLHQFGDDVEHARANFVGFTRAQT